MLMASYYVDSNGCVTKQLLSIVVQKGLIVFTYCTKPYLSDRIISLSKIVKKLKLYYL